MKRLNTELLSRVATDYVGEPVIVLVEQFAERALGQAWRSPSGDAFISISYPPRDTESVLMTFLHECRHFQRGDIVHPRTVTRPAERIAAEYRAEGREDAAQRFEARTDAREQDCEEWAAAELPKLLQTGIAVGLWID